MQRIEEKKANYMSEKTLKNKNFEGIQPRFVFRINNMNGNILAPFDMGSYITYKLFPNNLIYMDGRYEEVYFTAGFHPSELGKNRDGDFEKIAFL